MYPTVYNESLAQCSTKRHTNRLRGSL